MSILPVSSCRCMMFLSHCQSFSLGSCSEVTVARGKRTSCGFIGFLAVGKTSSGCRPQRAGSERHIGRPPPLLPISAPDSLRGPRGRDLMHGRDQALTAGELLAGDGTPTDCSVSVVRVPVTARRLSV